MVPSGGHVLALLVLLGSLVLVFAAWHSARERVLRAAKIEFVAQAGEIGDLFRQRLVNYELVTHGGASLFASVTRPTPQQWRGYVDGLNIGGRFPAMVGLGFAGYVPSSGLDDLQLEWRTAGYGLLEVQPHGIRDAYGPILYLEPRTPENAGAIGYDMFSEPVRREAMQAARDSGEARLSGVLQLIQDGAAQTPSLQLYLPVYRSGARPQTLAARRSSLQGWVYAPFRVGPFVRDALGPAGRDAHFRIFDITGGTDALLYSTFAAGGPAAAFRHAVLVEQYGRRWRIEFDSAPISVAVPDLNSLNNTMALGLFAALLMYGLAWMLARTEARAHKIALRMTEDFSRSEQRFRSAMQYSAIGKALLNSQGRITAANPALATIVGRDAATLVGERFDSLFEDDLAVVTGSPIGTTDGQGVHRTTRRLHREGGVPRHAQLTYAPVPGNVGEDLQGLVQVEDVTERLRAEARVHALNRTLESRVALRTRELSQANQELETFAYSVSHDLRAPLRAIDGFSRVLLERYDASLDDSGRDYLGRVRNAAGRMGELIDAMLTMSRLTRGELKPEPVDMSRLAGEVLEELRLGDEERQVECAVAPNLEAVGDTALLRNLLSNLLSNAWKFTRGRDDARIEFGIDPGGEFFVRDNGAGFAQEYVDKLFRPFQRLHTQAEFAGSGIGLASVKRIIDRHGGSIRAVGSEGEGATFYFSLSGGID